MSVLAARLTSEQESLHLSTAAFPGIGGTIKCHAEDFCVEEVMPYEPCGEGEHVYITVRRSGLTTPEVGKLLADRLGFPLRQIGWAGMKDKHAVTTQTFSLRLGWHTDVTEVRAQLEPIADLTILSVDKHRNKIKRGHVARNCFDILVRTHVPEAVERANAIACELAEQGVPNYYGEQRFSSGFKNIPQACRIFESGKVAGRKDTFMISVLQAAMFNMWLNRRFTDDLFSEVIGGDIAQKLDTGGLFDVEDLPVDQHRFKNKEITYTGPIYGAEMRQPSGTAGVRELDLLSELDIVAESFRPLKAPGSRRAAIIYPGELTVASDAEGVRLRFALPSGAYATNVVREFIK